MSEDLFPSDPGFPATQWSEVAAAGQGSTPQAELALEALLARYRNVLVAHVRSKFAVNPEDAEDLLHGFIEKKILQNNFLAGAEATRGRFRTYLLSSLDRFAISELRRQQAQKRHPGSELVSLDSVAEDVLASETQDSEEMFQRVWSGVAIAGALLNMHNQCLREGREVVWAVFQQRVLGPELADADPLPYDELRQLHQLDSPSSAFNLLNTAKRMFRRHLRDVVAEYSRSNEELEEELAYLRRHLQPRDC